MASTIAVSDRPSYEIVFAEQRATGLEAWPKPLSQMRVPKFFDLRADPFERGEESFKYETGSSAESPAVVGTAPCSRNGSRASRLPPRARAASFSIDQVVEKLMPKS